MLFLVRKLSQSFVVDFHLNVYFAFVLSLMSMPLLALNRTLIAHIPVLRFMLMLASAH